MELFNKAIVDPSNSINENEIIEDWINQYGDGLYSWAFHKTSSKEVAEDLVQDTFLSAFNSIDSFENRSNPKTWLFSILNNKIIDYYRKAARKFTSIETDSEKEGYQITESLFDNNQNWSPSGYEDVWDKEKHLLDDPEFIKIFDGCLKDLPAKWNLAVLAKYRLGKEAVEICQELNITPSNYWQIIRRSKLLLKKCIEKQWN
jgi:RNA polymerase sigma-70 factor (ECF subfamily)